MAYRLAFHYIPGSSAIHNWDVRCKLLGVLLISFCLLHAGAMALAGFSAILALVAVISHLPWKTILNDLKSWGLLLFVIFIVSAFSTPGPRFTALPWLPVSRSGMELALITCWRLGLIIGYGVVFTAVTRHREFQNALIWLLKPFPFVPARRVAFMATLTIRFIPLILDQAEDVRMALRARLGDQRKGPLQRMKFTAIPLLRRSFLRADELALAVAARGYREDLPLAPSPIPRGHLIGLLVLCLVVLAMEYGLPALAVWRY
jgi:energy-coupling factor transporter transmembrane protein EcfT